MHQSKAKKIAISLLLTLAMLVSAQAAEISSLIPIGHTVGIQMSAEGVLVVQLDDVQTADGAACPAREAGIAEGDLIVSVNGTEVSSNDDLQKQIALSGGQPVELELVRDGEHQTVTAAPCADEDGVYRIGILARDSMAGIGTMTYYDPETGSFGALGHGITDSDTGILMPFASGSLLPSAVKAVKKGASGEAGELRGDFDLTGDLGDLSANTSSGIFGTLDPGEFTERLGDPMPVAAAGEVHAGPATILSNVEGDAVREYDVEILQVVENAADGRDLVISVTDPELLFITGGIVQGMSGSPILQDGKFAGAVTHVLLNDPSKGYGILMETMLETGGGERLLPAALRYDV